MTRDDIIRMAREAGLYEDGKFFVLEHGELERFAALVAAAERDRMIADGWRQCAKGQRTSQFCAVAEQARAEEREACAIAGGAAADAGRDVASAIRARGQQRPEPTYPSDPIWREQKRLEMEAWARDKLARHGIQIPEDEDGNPSF